MAAPRQAETDAQLVELWLHGRSAHTRRAYRADVGRFLAFVGKPLRQVTLGDVQAFAEELATPATPESGKTLAPASQARALAAIKSVLAFGHRLGYLPFDVGGAVRLPKLKQTLAERILSEADVHRLLALESHARNRVLLRLTYAAGLRVSELVGLRWHDLQPRGPDDGQVTVYGKGGKTRTILLPASVWRDLEALRGAGADVDPDAPVFRTSTPARPTAPPATWRCEGPAPSRPQGRHVPRAPTAAVPSAAGPYPAAGSSRPASVSCGRTACASRRRASAS